MQNFRSIQNTEKKRKRIKNDFKNDFKNEISLVTVEFEINFDYRTENKVS